MPTKYRKCVKKCKKKYPKGARAAQTTQQRKFGARIKELSKEYARTPSTLSWRQFVTAHYHDK